jgi:hypothetical protein
MAITTRTFGKDIRVGDVIVTWAGKKRVVGLKPYTGPLAYLWPEGAQLADFDIGSGMTIAGNDLLDVVTVNAA